MNAKSPLNKLIGVWKGDKGMDIAPDVDGQEDNPYYETLTIEPVDIEIENADEQDLLAVRYHQIVREKADDAVSHSETGYWIWDESENTIMNSFSIPRGLSVLAGGEFSESKDSNELIFSVRADRDNPDWGIVQSPFLKKKANTIAFQRIIKVSDGVLSYEQEMTIDIYGKVFLHKDENVLTKS